MKKNILDICTRKALKLASPLASCILLLSCNNANNKNNIIDSIAVAKDYIKAHPSFCDTMKEGGFDIGEVKNLTNSKPFPDIETAKQWATNYTNNPISALNFITTETDQSGHSIKKKYLMQILELDDKIMSYVKAPANKVNGLRVYLAKKTNDPHISDYTLIVVAYDKDGKNATTAFDWHNPCPPYCTGTDPNVEDAKKFAGRGLDPVIVP